MFRGQWSEPSDYEGFYDPTLMETGSEEGPAKPTYDFITSYSTLRTFLQDALRREQLEVNNLLSGNDTDEMFSGLNQIEEDLLRLADRCKVLAQDVVSGALSKE